MNSVFRLAARRTKLGVQLPEPGAAPVSEKRIGLTRPHLSCSRLRAISQAQPLRAWHEF